MRSDIHEPGRGWLTANSKSARRSAAPLAASIVDAALGEESPPMSLAGARRDVAHAAASASACGDGASQATAEGEGPLLKQLSQQLSLLEAQQLQIRRLLEQTERRSRGADRSDG